MSETPRTALSADLWNAAVHQKDDAFAEALDSLVALVKEETRPESVWIVEGATGEYSDHCEWPVDAWDNKEAAEARVAFLGAKYREIVGVHTDRYTDEYEAAKEKMREFDPSFRCDYTGTRYHCYEVTLMTVQEVDG